MLHVAQAILRTAGVCLLLMLIGASCHMTSNETRDAYRRVKAKLLSHPYAVDKIPPKTLSGENINILIGFSPQQILSVNEVDMTVTVAASIAVGWSEPAFAWDVTDDDVDSVSVFARDVWTPTIVNSLSIESDDLVIELPPLLRIDHSGYLLSVQLLTMTVSCPFDMEWFPFDEQRCHFPFFPFNADSANINTVPVGGPQASVRHEDENSDDWTWEEVTPRETRSEINISKDTYKNFTYVSFEILMKRRGVTFYITNVIFPMAASGVLNLFVFLIPPSAGEKISFLVSIFISTSVFLSSLSNTISKGQGGICRFNVFVVAITEQNILATAASIFVLHRYMKEQEEKEGEVTSPKSPATEGDNSLHFEETPTHQRSPQRPTRNGDTDDPIKTVTSRSRPATPWQPQQDGFEEPVFSPAPVGHCQSVRGTPGREREVTGIRRYWTRGCRLSSTELDRMFFVVFTVTNAGIVLGILFVP